ncbi:hypothetical protein JG688_00004705 [Phytophthora aleatoria]|uniref:M96 mating-specific protein family n=1 Tax=Phytophthora aleatoria TaxID=2496075 RepID=A0A8J5MB52_9STRA|nr:hypothetical protein JG688_00004705 [Phytophthora aleatoria]
MAFLAQDDDAMRAFEAVLKFVDDFTVDQTLSADEAPNEAATAQPPVANGLETSPNGAPDYDHLSTDVVPANTTAENARKRMLRKAGVYGDPNRARNERKLEIAKARVWELCDTVCQRTNELYRDASFSIWEGLAARQRGQIKVAKSLENLLLKRAQQQIADCSSSIQKPGDICPPGRTLDFRADAADFQELLEYLDATYSEVDAVLAGNGLAEMEMTQQDLHMREGVDGMYLEVFSNKVMPFSLHATGEATWNYFKGSEKHRGNFLDTPYTIIEHFSKELFAGNSCTDVRVKQIIRRYVEADREVVVWVATITPIEIKRKAFTGLTSHHRNYAVIKRAKASTPERELSLLQLVAHVTLDTEEGTIYDPMYIRALTDFLLSNAAGNIKADQELIENVLMDQTLDQH